MIRSLRWRLLVGTTVVSGAILAILGIAIDRAVHHTLREEFDRVLLEKGRSLASMVERQAQAVHFDYEQSHFPEFEPGAHPAYFQILLDGRPFRHSPSLPEGAALLADPARAAAQTVALPDALPGRALATPFLPFVESDDAPGPATAPSSRGPTLVPQGVVIVAENTLRLDRTLHRLRLLLGSLCAGAALLCGLAMFMVVHRTVKPVRRLARAIEELPETSLGTVLDPGDLPSELVPVVDCLNGQLRRLSAAFERERLFTADVAHELRTPLAGLLATLEVARSRPRDIPSYQATIDKCLLMLSRMQRLIENLLMLARAESHQLAVRRTSIDLPALLAECWRAFEPLARERQLSCQSDLPDAVPAIADAEFLALICNNLFDNAITYTPQGGQIDVRLISSPPSSASTSAQTHLALVIANTSRDLTHADLPRLTQRFWRKDAARATTGIHAGVGLSLCHRLASLQGCTLALRIEGEKLVVQLDIPAAPAPIADAGA
jgi:two-component system sensor histidine kinase QseC